MKYNFDEVIDRRNSASLKWDVKENELPMWVADMDFKTAPEIRDALNRRLEHGVFGYSVIPDEWYEAYINWWKERHNVTFCKEALTFCTGVVPAISSIVRKLTTPAEKVVLMTPVYNIFFNSILNNGRVPIQSRMIYENGEYSPDFADLEDKLSDPQTTLMILCNPQNPSGKIWDKETLAKIGQLCSDNHVTVVSDEIHCDLCDPGYEYVPFSSVNDVCRSNSITLIAPTKAFNIAGLQTAAVMVDGKNLRHKVWRALNTDEVAEPNAFAITAAVAAFTKGGEWLDELCEYIYQNKLTASDFIKKNLPQVKLMRSPATYLLWLDCSKICDDSRLLAKHIRKTTGLYISAGSGYGSGGEQFLRINVAAPKSTVIEGLKRLKDGIDSYIE